MKIEHNNYLLYSTYFGNSTKDISGLDIIKCEYLIECTHKWKPVCPKLSIGRGLCAWACSFEDPVWERIVKLFTFGNADEDYP